MGLWKGIVWAVGRNTEWGRKQLGEETLQEQVARDLQPQGRTGISAKELRRIALETAFGSGLSGGDNYWTAPVHAVLDDGRPVTVAFGKEKRSGQILISEGHLTMEAFYARGRGHDHFGPNGELYGDRGALD